MKNYYTLKPDGTWDRYPINEEDLDDFIAFAKGAGAEVVTESEMQRRNQIPSRTLHKEAAYLADLGARYKANPRETTQEMIDAGYDPRGGGAGKALSQFSGVVAPALATAEEQGMGVGGQIGAGAIDLGATISGAKIPGMVLGALAKKGAGQLAKYVIPTVADVATNAVAGGVQQGYGKGGFDPSSAMAGGGVSGGIGAVGGTLKAVGPTGLKALMNELGGVGTDVAEQYARGGAGREAILNATPAGEISSMIREDIKNWDDLIPEATQVQEALQGKAVNLNTTIQTITDAMDNLKGSKMVLSPTEEQAYKKLAVWRDRLAQMPIEIGANDARKLRSQLDNAIDYNDPSIGQGAGALAEKAFKQASSTLRGDLIEAGGPEYASIMKSWSDKLESLKGLKSVLGSDFRSESVIDNLFNRNKGQQQEVFKKFDEVFGKDYTSKIRNSAYSKNLGIDLSLPVDQRTPAITSRQSTGRSLMGLTIAGAGSGLGGIGISPVLAPIAPIAMTAWSPRAGLATLSEMYNPSKASQAVQEVARYGKSVSKGTKEKKESKRKISDYNPNP
jgi:hypothetical protein